MKREVLVITVHVRIGLAPRLWRLKAHTLWKWTGGLYHLVLGVEHLGHVALQLVSLGLHVLNGEGDDCSAHLHRHRVMRLEPQPALEQDDRTKLGGVVLDVEAILLALDDGMAPAH